MALQTPKFIPGQADILWRTVTPWGSHMTEKIGGYPKPSVQSKPTGTQAPKRPDAGTTASNSAPAGAEAGGDAISLTETATRLKVIEAKLEHLPEVDRERVEALRSMIESGNYEINARQIAQRLAELERLIY
jgi:negative regulator of flagellin synthesis FlgM